MNPQLSNQETGYPWKVVLQHPTDSDNWYIYNVQTNRYKKIGRVGATRTNYYEKAIQEAISRNKRNQE